MCIINLGEVWGLVRWRGFEGFYGAGILEFYCKIRIKIEAFMDVFSAALLGLGKRKFIVLCNHNFFKSFKFYGVS